MTLIDFISEYPDEDSCKAKFKQYREHIGVIYPKCESKDHYWKRDKDIYECKKCKHRQSLRANTVMHLLAFIFFVSLSRILPDVFIV